MTVRRVKIIGRRGFCARLSACLSSMLVVTVLVREGLFCGQEELRVGCVRDAFSGWFVDANQYCDFVCGQTEPAGGVQRPGLGLTAIGLVEVFHDNGKSDRESIG